MAQMYAMYVGPAKSCRVNVGGTKAAYRKFDKDVAEVVSPQEAEALEGNSNFRVSKTPIVADRRRSRRAGAERVETPAKKKKVLRKRA